jgi:DNA/RNA endonuclease YhcR with UshA esterase domain
MKKFLILLSLSPVLFLSSCVKEDFDSPENNNTDPAGISANITIAAMKALYADTILNNNAIVQIEENHIISGIVAADDKSGNFYKSIIIQDATGGIAIRIDRSDFYTDYPVGRRVFVKCKGLFIGQYNKLIQMGGYIDNSSNPPSVASIPSPLIPNYFVKGQWGLPVTATKVYITDLNDTYQNMLIRLDSVEFQPADTAQLYANAQLQQSVNRTLKDCNGNTIILRSSGYANFANSLTPTGNGTLYAIYQVFGTTKQLYIRDLSDVQLTGTRCGGGGGGAVLVTIASIRALYTGSNTTVPANRKIKGIVISDRVNQNTDSRNLIIQDASAGIVVRFANSHTFDLNDEVEVDISNQALITFSSLLEVDNVPNANATKTGTGTVTPQVLTIAQINSGTWTNLESTLVKVNNCTISGAQPLSGSKTLNDGTGTLTLYTRSQATFASTNYPTGTVSITGFLGIFNTTKQISVRSMSDIQ